MTRSYRVSLCCAFVMFAAGGSHAAFFESFSGTGPFASVNEFFQGLDNAGWHIGGDGRLEDGGYRFTNTGPMGYFGSVSDRLEILVPLEHEDFITRLEFGDLFLGEITDLDGFSVSSFVMHQTLGPRAGASIGFIETAPANPGEWRFRAGDALEVISDSAADAVMEIRYNKATSAITYYYDDNVRDDVESTVFGPFPYAGGFDREQQIRIKAAAVDFAGRSDGIVKSLTISTPSDILGDINGNRLLDTRDITLLGAEVRRGSVNPYFDMNRDGLIDGQDRNVWVHDLKNTYFGDANLDGEFNSLDLITTFQMGEYEDTLKGNSTWVTGDWNADGEFSTKDLIVAFQDGGYEQGPRASVQSVPEPTGLLLSILALLAILPCRRL